MPISFFVVSGAPSELILFIDSQSAENICLVS